MNSVNVDIGGTFTDCFAVWRDKSARGKALTTRYDLAVGFMAAIEDATAGLGIPLPELLKGTEIVRYCTTVATNTLIERTGPKLGLITTAGQEDTIFIGRARQSVDGATYAEIHNLVKMKKPDPLIPREMVVGVRERIDCKGQVIIPLSKEDVVEKVRYLEDQGVRGIVICLLWSFVNPVHEKMLKEIIEEQYPPSYLGNMPVILSSELMPKHGEYARAMTTILTAYMHTELAEGLRSLGEQLKGYGFERALTVVDCAGGSASVIKMPAVKTYNSGPVAGVMGAPVLTKVYDLDKVLLTDMGGTSFDVAALLGGQPRYYEFRPVIQRFRVATSPLEVQCIGAGGGSIAWIDPVGRLQVGPQSAGAMPGPACYDFGGTEATVTDADVVLGYIDPEFFLGGKQKLNKENAIQAIEDKIAKPLKMDVPEAAVGIRKVINTAMSSQMSKELSMRGLDAREFICFAYGGAGPAHCCDYCLNMGIHKIYGFSYGSVFCAFGAASIDLAQSLELAGHITLNFPFGRGYTSEYEEFNQKVKSLQAILLRDLIAQGAREEEIKWSLELEMRYGGQLNTLRTPVPLLFIKNEQDVKDLCQAFDSSFAAIYSKGAALPQAGTEVESFALKGTWPLPKYELPSFPVVGTSPKAALKGKRPVCWEIEFKETPVYAGDLLKSGNVIEGPAIIEEVSATFAIAEGWKASIDRYLTRILEYQK
jgi:N-methylhydantoinase A/acetophenone carboxylase